MKYNYPKQIEIVSCDMLYALSGKVIDIVDKARKPNDYKLDDPNFKYLQFDGYVRDKGVLYLDKKVDAKLFNYLKTNTYRVYLTNVNTYVECIVKLIY